jgi:hypothetical protein
MRRAVAAPDARYGAGTPARRTGRDAARTEGVTMTTELTATASTARASLSGKNKAGLVVAALLGLADLASLAGPQPEPGEPGPPVAVLVVGTVLGLVTLLAAAYAWRTGNRVGSRVVAGTRILSALLAVPAFFVEGVPAGLVAVAAAGVLLTVACVWLVLSPPRASGTF